MGHIHIEDVLSAQPGRKAQIVILDLPLQRTCQALPVNSGQRVGPPIRDRHGPFIGEPPLLFSLLQPLTEKMI